MLNGLRLVRGNPVDLLTWVGLIGVGLIPGLGGSYVRRMLSGQLDVDDADG